MKVTESLIVSVSLSPAVGVAFQWEGHPDFHFVEPCASKKEAQEIARAIEHIRGMPLGAARMEWVEANHNELKGKIMRICSAIRLTREGTEGRRNEFDLKFRL